MKKLFLAALLALVAMLAIACQPQSNTPLDPASDTNIQVQQPPLTLPTATPAIAGLPENYDPSSEEDAELPLGQTSFGQDGVAVFAGSTPIPLDPVDLPTAPPRQALVFTYATYTAANLGLSFESVAGYTVDDSQQDTYILTEPAEQQKDNYSVSFTFTLTPVSSSYNTGNLKSEIRTFVTNLGQVNYSQWRISETAERTLLGKPGYYITYRGEMYDGTIVRGRVHMALLDNNRVLSLHYTGPGEYNSDYTEVFYRIRSTLKAI